MALDYVRTQVTAAKEIGVYGVIPRHLVREHFWYSFFAGLPKNQTKNSKSNFRRLTDLRISHLTFYKRRWYSNRDRTFNSLKYSSTLRLTASNFAIKKSRSGHCTVGSISLTDLTTQRSTLQESNSTWSHQQNKMLNFFKRDVYLSKNWILEFSAGTPHPPFKNELT